MMNITELISSFRAGEFLSKAKLTALYEAAKEAYYSGTAIIEDFEFDSIEDKLKLTNKSYVGTKHNPSYTVKHPFVMGSLSKVQIHKDNSGFIDWNNYFAEVCKYVKRFDARQLIVSPKYDGCSFEAQCSGKSIVNICSRGDGEFGADYTKHLSSFVIRNTNVLGNSFIRDYTLRGEVLIKKSVFEKKYSDFVNPRSFVSGVLNREFSMDADFQDMLNDFSIVIYDIRVKSSDTWQDVDWMKYNYPDKPKYYIETSDFNNSKDLESIYNTFAKYREVCEFALDGIVFKPAETYRKNNLTDHRPSDCVAVKFIPMLNETVVTKIEWNVKKYGNLIPTIWFKPVDMDGKTVQKCSGSNYSVLINKKVSVGTKIIVSLAGDIIPFLYKVTDDSAFDENNMDIPADMDTFVDGVHLKVVMSEADRIKQSFIYSGKLLNIPNIGPANVENIFNFLDNQSKFETDDFFGENSNEDLPVNILQCSPDTVYFGVGCGKNGQNCKKSFIEFIKNVTLADIIRSCNFKFCGNRMSEQVANYLIGKPYFFEHMAAEGYEWVMNKNSENMQKLIKVLTSLGKSVDDYKPTDIEVSYVTDNRIPVILTGEPAMYSTKADFMNKHPEYVLTGSWKEVKIVFTNSFDSSTSKMKKAKEKGIEIKLY